LGKTPFDGFFLVFFCGRVFLKELWKTLLDTFFFLDYSRVFLKELFHPSTIYQIIQLQVKPLRPEDVEDPELRRMLTTKPLFGKDEHYEKCAIVSNAGALRNSYLGAEIGETICVLKIFFFFSVPFSVYRRGWRFS
jgi:Glycosyltransferase family 29 (sialyltransferase).